MKVIKNKIISLTLAITLLFSAVVYPELTVSAQDDIENESLSRQTPLESELNELSNNDIDAIPEFSSSTICQNHEFGEWTITAEPTQDSEGEKTRTCNICNEVEIKTIPATTYKCFSEYMNHCLFVDETDSIIAKCDDPTITVQEIGSFYGYNYAIFSDGLFIINGTQIGENHYLTSTVTASDPNKAPWYYDETITTAYIDLDTNGKHFEGLFFRIK